jgi:hypothetical protein
MARDNTTYGTVGIAVLIALVAFLSSGSVDPLRSSDVQKGRASSTDGLKPAGLIRAYLDVRDTLFSTDSVYLDVDLSRQTVTIHRRDASQRTFPISSGTPWIREGMATPTGIFTVQNKVPLAISRQFNDARMYNWIGVYGGVGFHGLDGTGYYGTLGVRPSSHGCIRMARADVREMYDMVHVGAPILVHNGKPARVVAFCDPVDTVNAFVIDSSRAAVRGIGDDRIADLYDGRYFETDAPRLVHLAGTRIHWHIDAGRKSLIPRQRVPKTIPLPSVGEGIWPDRP